MAEKDLIMIGTRGSKLALWQSEWVKSLLIEQTPGLKVELRKIKTTGDKITDVPLAQVGGKGLFVKEIEEALISGEVDLAVHSMKDVPTEFPGGLHLSAILKREDPRDAFISNKYGSFHELPEGATVGTSSLRRSCQLLSHRPDLEIVSLRGNLDTRLRKLDEGQFDAIILALAGVRRLGYEDRVKEALSAEIVLPAIGQGAVGIECRTDDPLANRLSESLDHQETSQCVRAERACLLKLEGGCQVPIAAHAVITEKGTLYIRGLVGSLSGDTIIKAEREGDPVDAEVLGARLAEDLLSGGAKPILDAFYGKEE